MTTILKAGTSAVAIALISTFDGIDTDMVGLQLPRNSSTVASKGYVQVTPIAGVPTVDVPMRNPWIQVDCWAVQKNSQRPLWKQAENLANLVVAGCYAYAAQIEQAALPIGTGYPQAQVHTVYVTTEPRPVFEEEANYARYMFEAVLSWTELP